MLKDSFLKYLLLERNYSEKTVLSYGIDLDEFEAYFKGVDVELEFTSVDADVVRGWVLSLMDEGRAETTVNRKLSSLRSFYHYLLRQKLVAVVLMDSNFRKLLRGCVIRLCLRCFILRACGALN